MIKIDIQTAEFQQQMENIMEYSTGFFEGVEKAKPEFFKNIGDIIAEGLKQFIDANARLDPERLHHVYEWYQTGSPESRLFEIEYQATKDGLSFNSTFSQSRSIQQGSKVPFYNKAEIMENGLPITIIPKANKPLVFQDGMDTVFTKAPVMVSNPGGNLVAGSYRQIFEQFFTQYFSQSFLQSSGILEHINDTKPFESGFAKANTGGKGLGITVGYKWFSKTKGGIVS
jgi:hypothetical protein